MSDSTFGFIGLGLIGGSIARGLRRANKDITIMAYMRTRSKLEQAKADGTIDIILDGIDETLSACDVIFLCTPVEYNAVYLEKVRPFLKPGALITDIGSTKTDIHQAVERLGYEDVFVGGHPMAGSEKTGYESSTDHLLENAYYIITPTKKSTPEQIDRIRQVALGIGALPIVLDYHEHDFSVAAISHLPHLVASSLVNLVHDNDSGKYRSTFPNRGQGPIERDYSFCVDVLDEPGSISVLSAILAAKGISVKNIGINHSREEGEGALRISFYKEDKKNEAAELLRSHNYVLTK